MYLENMKSNELQNSQLNNAAVNNSHKEKDFVQWLTEDALPITKDILAKLKVINAKQDEAMARLRENNVEVTEDTTEEGL